MPESHHEDVRPWRRRSRNAVRPMTSRVLRPHVLHAHVLHPMAWVGLWLILVIVALTTRPLLPVDETRYLTVA